MLLDRPQAFLLAAGFRKRVKNESNATQPALARQCSSPGSGVELQILDFVGKPPERRGGGRQGGGEGRRKGKENCVKIAKMDWNEGKGQVKDEGRGQVKEGLGGAGARKTRVSEFLGCREEALVVGPQDAGGLWPRRILTKWLSLIAG